MRRLAAVSASLRGRNVVVGNIAESGLDDSSYEVCTMIEVLEHIEDYAQVLREAHRVCSSKLILTVPNIAVIPAMSDFQVVPWHLLEASHVNFFTPGSLWEINPWFQPGLFDRVKTLAIQGHFLSRHA
jgi:hypothetical protein